MNTTTAEPTTESEVLEGKVLEEHVDQLPAEPNQKATADPMAPTQESATPSQLLFMAVDRGADLAMIEKLMDLQDRHDAKQAMLAYKGAMARAQGKIDVIAKNQKNDHTKSEYADLGAILEQAVPAYSSEGISIEYDTEPSPAVQGWIRHVAYISHEDGHEQTRHVDLPPDSSGAKGGVNKTDIQAAVSSIAYARRTLMKMIFNIGEKDDDGNAPKHTSRGNQESTEPTRISENTLKMVRDGLEATGKTEADCIRMVNKNDRTNVGALENLTEDQGLRLSNWLNRAADAKASKQ